MSTNANSYWRKMDATKTRTPGLEVGQTLVFEGHDGVVVGCGAECAVELCLELVLRGVVPREPVRDLAG